MNRAKAIHALTHTTVICVDNEQDLWRCATEEEARAILDTIEETK